MDKINILYSQRQYLNIHNKYFHSCKFTMCPTKSKSLSTVCQTLKTMGHKTSAAHGDHNEKRHDGWPTMSTYMNGRRKAIKEREWRHQQRQLSHFWLRILGWVLERQWRLCNNNNNNSSSRVLLPV